MASNTEANLSKAYVDFIKGKSGPPNARVAKLFIEGDISPDQISPPKLSKTYDEFSEEYFLVVAGLRGCSLEKCLDIIGSMLTLPEFHSNTYRLEVLVNLAFIHAKGKKSPSPEQISAWFNLLDNGTCDWMEDPAEDVFLSKVATETADYLLFQGSEPQNSYYTQIFIKVIEALSENNSYKPLKSAVINLLKISNETAVRTGLEAFDQGTISPRSKIEKPSDEIWSLLKKRVRFTFDELDAFGIDVQSLTDFIANGESKNDILKFQYGNTPIDFKPIFLTKNGIIVFFPNLIGMAIRHSIIQHCICDEKNEQSLHKALVNAYQESFLDEKLFQLRANPPQLNWEKSQGYYVSQNCLEFDAGRYMHLVFLVDGFDNYTYGRFMGMNPISEISKLINQCIDEGYKDISNREGFKEGLTVLVLCGWGRAMSLGLNENLANWRTVVIPAHDVETISRISSFDPLDILRVLDAEKAINDANFDFYNASGFLNLFAWIEDNNGHIFPHEEFSDGFDGDSERGFYNIPINANLKIRRKAHLAHNRITLQRPDGGIAKLRRAMNAPKYGTTELSPIYMDTTLLEPKIRRLAFIGKNNTYWMEVDASSVQDHSTRLDIFYMMMTWCEIIFGYFDEQEINQTDTNVACRFCFLDKDFPNPSDPIPDVDKVSSLITRRGKEDHTLIFDINVGFLGVARRTDNIGELEIAKALIETFFESSSCDYDESKIDDVLKSVVKSDMARHMHAFTNLYPRDHVRKDLSGEPQIIERMDDAYTNIGMAWLCRNPSDGYHITELKECKKFLNSLVEEIANHLISMVKLFDKNLLIEVLLRNHESLQFATEEWKRTFGAILALCQDEQRTKKYVHKTLGQFNASSMSCRIVLEVAACESPSNSGSKPGKYDIAQMLAYASLIHHMGGYSDAMHFGMMPPEIKISPAGNVMIDHRLFDDIIDPFGQFFQNKSLHMAEHNYSENYAVAFDDDDREKTKTLFDDAEFLKAWKEEFGYTLEDFRDVASGFGVMLMDDGKATLKIKFSELLSRICDGERIESEAATACIMHFSLLPRRKWNESPSGYLNSAWYPWHFRRQLSIISKPIIHLNNEENPTCFFAPAMVVLSMGQFAQNAYEGIYDDHFFRKNGLMFKWTGNANQKLGEQFNTQVADKFKTIGWKSKANLSDGSILKRAKNPKFGDVDVLAWNKEQGRVLVIECKDLMFDKTIGEIVRRLSDYQGNITKGKRDSLKKHLDRCHDLENNISQLSEFVAFDIKHIERVLVFSQPNPLQFSDVMDKNSVDVCIFEEIQERYGL